MINRCVCTKQTFVELLGIADQHGLNFDELSERTACGSKCGLCVPFIRAVLDRRQTEFRVGEVTHTRETSSAAR